MAMYHLSATMVQRSKGQSAIAGAAYRSATRLEDRRSGVVQDYTRKHGVVQSVIIAPAHAPAWVHEREELWNQAELSEKRKDSQPAREIKLALPHELTDEQRANLVFEYCRDVFVSAGMIADISIHRPDRRGDERNHHAHVMLTMRELDGDRFSARKQTDWNKKDMLEYWREQWAIYQNRALDEVGSDAYVDHRSFEDRGIEQIPTVHLGRDATAMERRGEPTELGDLNREIEAANQRIGQLVSERNALDAEIAEERAKAWSDVEVEPDHDLDEPEEAEHKHDSFPAALTQQEVDLSNNPISKMFEQQLREKGSIGSPDHDLDGLERMPDDPDYLYGEAAEHKHDSFPAALTQQEVDLSDNPISKMFEQQLREYGSIQSGRNWYNRAATFWLEVYDDATMYVKDTWQKYVTDRREKEQSPDRESGLLDTTIDRAKDLWQKYISGRENSPDRDDVEPDR